MTDTATNNFVNKKMAGIKNRIMNLIGRCVLAAVKDDKKMQEVKVTILAEETKEELEHFQDYGFTANAPQGSEGLAVSLNGNRDHTVVICIDSREFRLKNLASGEVAVYSKFGTKIVLKADGTIENKSDHVKMTGKQTVKENIYITDQNTDIASIKNIYNSHTHPDSHGGNTGTPNQPI